ncbi:MAG: hypothetical protein ACYDBQ_07665 [Thermoplasmatota archaeon]
MRRLVLGLIVLSLAAALLPTPGTAASFGTFGAKVLSTSLDYKPHVQAVPGPGPTMCARDTGTVGVSSDDLYYIHMAGTGTTVSAFDLRVTTAEGRQAGTLVLPGDTDVGQTFTGTGKGLTTGCAPFAANVRYLESDGFPGWTAGDELVWSTDAILNVGVVRLTAPVPTGEDAVSVSAGTVVATLTDSDASMITNNNGLYPDCTGSPPTAAACGTTAILLGAGTFSLVYVDANLNAAVDSGDSLYISQNRLATPDTTTTNINDVILLTPAGSAFGTRVARSSADYLLKPEILCAGGITQGCFSTAPILAYVRYLGADSSCDRLFIHFKQYDGASTVVQNDDLVLYSPAAGLTSCPVPPPASSIAPGTRVSGTTTFQGSVFTGTAALASNIYYVDANGNGRWDSTDPAYIHRPTALGGSTNTVGLTAGDFRITSITAGSNSYAAGSIVAAGDGDLTAYGTAAVNNEAGKAWVVRKLNYDGANPIPLQTVTSVIYHDANANGVWDPATESVYLDVGTTGNGCGTTGTTGCVNTGDFLLHKGSDSGVSGAAATAPYLNTAITCPGPVDCTWLSTSLVASTDFKTTGGDNTADVSQKETIYFSKDLWVNDEDYALPAATGSTVSGGVDGQVPTATCTLNALSSVCADEGIQTSDQLYFSWCPAAGCPGRMIANDLSVSPTMGTRQTSTIGGDLMPTLKALPQDGGTLLRYNAGDASTVTDDTWYVQTSSATTVTVNALRLLPLGTNAAGTIVQSGDVADTSALVTADPSGAGSFACRLASRDVDGIAGYSLGDPVYVNNPGPAFGGTTDGVLSQFDERVSTVTSGGLTFNPGTFVVSGNQDLLTGTAFTGVVQPPAPPCNTAAGWTVGYWDDNQNNQFDFGDVMYALPPGSPALSTFPTPVLGAVYLTGAGGSTTTTSSGGGGGGYVPPPTTSPAAVTTTTTAPPSSTTTAAPPPTTTPAATQAVSNSALGTDNLAIDASLTVTQTSAGDVLTWTAQAGAAGYQIWRDNGQGYVLVGNVNGTTTYTDAQGGANSFYLVTVYSSDSLGSHGYALDITKQGVPSGGHLKGVHALAMAPSTSKPKSGPGVATPTLVAGLMALAFVAARRRR